MSANITQLIPDSFCPGKWDELCLNLNYNYAYGCCSAVPMTFVKDFNEVLDKQKANLLNGVKDSSCNYCWDIEKAGGISKRSIKYLNNFNPELFDSYADNSSKVKLLEVNLGNECNFQCTYCNPKYSSQWEADIRKQPYKIFTDRFNYGLLDKADIELGNTNKQMFSNIGHLDEARIIGGEPLTNKNLWSLLDAVDADRLQITTNLSCKTATIDKLMDLARTKFKKIRLQISIDSTKEISEFVRYGMVYDTMMSNIEYLLATAPDNVLITIASTISSITVRGIEEFTEQVKQWQSIRPTLIWTLVYCNTPATQSFATLPDHYRADILQAVAKIKLMPNIEQLDTIETSLNKIKFNATMHKEMKNFMQQFADRKNIKIPLCLE